MRLLLRDQGGRGLRSRARNPKVIRQVRWRPDTRTPARTHRVCQDCNTELGRALDLQLSRHSLEAVLRIQCGLGADAEARNYLKKRIRLCLPRDHRLSGLHLHVVAQPSGDIAPTLLPQARIRLKDGSIRCILKEDLARELPPLIADIVEKGVSLYWSATDSEDELRLKALVADAGYQVVDWTPDPVIPTLTPEELEMEVTASIDQVLARAMAKIGFNYFVHVAGMRSPSLILRSNFDAIREFVRYGKWGSRTFVRPTHAPILADEHEEGQRVVGHLLTLVWGQVSRSAIIAQVSLFNEIRYDIVLSELPPVVWADLGSGHFYNVKSKTVSLLHVGRHIVLPRL